jgi:hypothetical protein
MANKRTQLAGAVRQPAASHVRGQRKLHAVLEKRDEEVFLVPEVEEQITFRLRQQPSIKFSSAGANQTTAFAHYSGTWTSTPHLPSAAEQRHRVNGCVGSRYSKEK